MRIYISGPMTGYPDLNFPEFNRVAAALAAKGYDVVNPVDINPDPNADWFECIVADMDAVRGCAVIYMLNGWEESPGAQIEYWTARKYQLTILYQSDYGD